MNTRICIGLAVGIMVATGSSVQADVRPECVGPGTNVGGVICTDTTWTAAGSPYVLTSTVLVGCGATLTIEPDVCVRFKSNRGLQVGDLFEGAGTLVARGTAESPIIFTTNDPYEVDPPDPALANPGDWARIYFTDYATDAEYDEFGDYVSGSVLEHIIVEYAGSGDPAPPAITGENSSPYLAYCHVQYIESNGINVMSSGAEDVKIHHCVVHDGSNAGIWVDATGGRAVEIEHCQVTDQSGKGIGVEAGSFLVRIENCEIARCTAGWHGGGIYLNGGAGHIVSHNVVEDCSVTVSGHAYGGGIYVNASATLDGNTVTNNSLSASGYDVNAFGGGMYINGVGTLDGNTVTHNTMNASGSYSDAGGGMYLGGSSDGSTLLNNVVTDNSANSSNPARGGGIYLHGSGSCELTSNTVTRNSADGLGGGISLRSSGNSTLSENIITDNWTTGQWGHGGGIYLEESGSCLIEDNTVTGNSTSGQNAHGGGIYLYNSSTGTGMQEKGLWGNTISDNVTTGVNACGGGMFLNNSSNTHLESNTITGNTSKWWSGGIYFWNSGQWVLKSNVITDNAAAGNAGGICIENSGCAAGDPRCTMTDTVVARNHTNGDTGGIYVDNSPWVSFAGDPETCMYNCICDNDGYCIYNDTLFDPAGSGNIDARYVKWCTTEVEDIDACIYDFWDDASLGRVRYSPFVSSTTCEDYEWPAWRDLSIPELAYRPDVPKVISIQIRPPDGAETILLEDKPPTGWTVSEISDSGSWDAVNELVKWGPFFAPDIPTEIHYTVTPPEDAEEEVCFAGTISIDGENLGICGDKCIDRYRCPYIPADEPQDYCAGCGGCGCATCKDNCVEMCEVGGYACAWKKDCNDDLAGMTRAAYIWKGGECCYCWDEAEQNWFITTCPAPESGCCGDGDGGSAFASTGGSATRQFGTQGAERNLPDCYSPGVGFDVTVTIDTPDDLLAIALEDQPPAGWTVGEMSDGCELGPETGKVKCGPYFPPDIPTEVTYEVLPPPDAAREGCFTGTVSFDGINQPIGGDTFVPLAHWADCMTGPSGGPYDPPCGALDFDLDDDVDLEDFAEFQRILCVP